MEEGIRDSNPALRSEENYLTAIRTIGGSNLSHLNQASEDSSLQSYVRLLLKHRFLILACSVFVFVSSVLYSFLATPKYTATATVRISTYAPLLPGSGAENTLLQQSREQDYFNTLVDQLKSLSLADRVLGNEDMRQNVQNYLERKTSFLQSLRSLVTFDRAGKDEKKATLDANYKHPVALLNAYLRLINVAPVKKTTLVKVSALSSIPRLSAQIANNHAQAFIDLVRVDRQRSTLDNLAFLKSQAEELREKVAAAERAVATYAEQNAIVSINKDENIVVKQMSELNALLTEATGKRIKSESAFREAKNSSALGTSALDDPSIQQLRGSLKEVESEYAQLSEKFTPAYPRMVQLRARRDSLKEMLEHQHNIALGALEGQYKADLDAERKLEEQLEIQKSKAFDLSRSEVQYNVLRREYDSLKDLHQTVLRQLKEAQLTSESGGSNVFLSEFAPIPTTHSSPQRGRNILFSLFFGPIIGFGLALFLEKLDNTVKTPEDIEQYLQIPALGMVPLFSAEKRSEELSPAVAEQSAEAVKSAESTEEEIPILTPETAALAVLHNTSLVTIHSPRSLSAEAFRTIRTGIMLSSADTPPKLIMITSAKQEEGKTTVSLNLSCALAQATGKTIIIEADLRRPKFSKNFPFLLGAPGIVDYLTGQSALDQVIYPAGSENLFIIPAGSLPPNPAELVGSQKMMELLGFLKSRFDYVLVDTPPLIPVADALMISRMVDGVLLVIRSNSTERHLAREASIRLKQVGAKILGVVLNRVNARSGSYYAYYGNTYSYYSAEDSAVSQERRA